MRPPRWANVVPANWFTAVSYTHLDVYKRQNETYVGRLRRDDTVDHGLAMWVVADQIRKGAALNAVQIAQLLLP